MKKISVLISHWKNWKWLPIAISNLKQYGFSGIPFEILVADNSPGHPSIKSLTETPLGEGVKIIQGDPELPSHGQGYSLCYEQSEGSHIFTVETDSFPTRHGWFEPYIKASVDADYIGPHMSLAGGVFIHPCGALVDRKVVEAAKKWQASHEDWWFCPAMGISLGLSGRAYHVVAHKEFLDGRAINDQHRKEMMVWRRAGPWQEMRAFSGDTFENYMHRTSAKLEPEPFVLAHKKIGYEPGQWLYYFAKESGFRCLSADHSIEWIPGFTNRQAAQSTVFGGFTHVWCGTSAFCDGIDPKVREFKARQMNEAWMTITQDIREQIEELERINPS